MDSPNVGGGRGAGSLCAVGGGLARYYTGVICSVCEGARVTVLRAPELKLAATAAGRRKKMPSLVPSDVAASFYLGTGYTPSQQVSRVVEVRQESRVMRV